MMNLLPRFRVRLLPVQAASHSRGHFLYCARRWRVSGTVRKGGKSAQGTTFESLVSQFPEDHRGLKRLTLNKFLALNRNKAEEIINSVPDVVACSRLQEIYDGSHSTSGLSGPTMPTSSLRLFQYFSETSPPTTYGYSHSFPQGVSALFSTTSQAKSTLIIRQCYERILSIVSAGQVQNEVRTGIIFSGGQGNGKTWCSLFIVWHLLAQGRTVVYEICQQGIVYVIRSDGSMRCCDGAATMASIPELGDSTTVHVFDAKAKAGREPVESSAFLVEFTSRNSQNYAQTARRPGMLKYCIPSYTRAELLRYCGLFGVPPEVVQQRCMEIGPSIRYVLVNDYEECKAHTEAVARRVTADQMDQYIGDSQKLSGDSEDISACLVIAKVNEGLYVNPNDAYKESNVLWEFASKSLAKIVLESASNRSEAFVKNFITVVNRRGLTKMKGVAGNYLELIVGPFLCGGTFTKCRMLAHTGRNLNQPLQKLEPWTLPLQEVESSIVDVSAALAECTATDTLYSFCKSMEAFDFSAQNFTYIFQITNSSAHSVHLSAVRAVCNHVREKQGADATVRLVFVVPEVLVSTAPGGSWQYTQSYVFDVEEKAVEPDNTISKKGNKVKKKKAEVQRLRQVQRKYLDLPAEVQNELRNLEQWVICYAP